jgi:hypothetical protein
MKNKQKNTIKYNGFWKWFFYLELLFLLFLIGLTFYGNFETNKPHKCEAAWNCKSIGNNRKTCNYCLDKKCKKIEKITCYGDV